MGCWKDACSDCSVWARLFIVVCGIAAVILGAFAAASCEFVDFRYAAEANSTHLAIGSFGLFRVDYVGENCRTWTGDEQDDFDAFLNSARYSSIASVVCGVIAVVLLWMEFTCCRFACGRFLECLFVTLAALAMGITALSYASNRCDDRNQRQYPCTIGSGTYFAISSFALYLFMSLLICVTEKPEPTCVRMSKSDENDPCCWYCRRQEVENHEDENESLKEEKKRGCFLCWRKEEKEEEAEEAVEGNGEEDDAEDSDSHYHDSVAEPDEIPEAVVVTASSGYLDPVQEEDAPAQGATTAWAPTFFWPKPVEEEPTEPDEPDLFFDAQASARDAIGKKENLSAEVY